MADDDEPEIRPWREREAAGRPRGVVLDPSREPVPRLDAHGTVYAPGHLIVSGDTTDAEAALNAAAAELGWSVVLEPIRTEQQGGDGLTKARIIQLPNPNRDDEPVPPVDAWRLLQQARRAAIIQAKIGPVADVPVPAPDSADAEGFDLEKVEADRRAAITGVRKDVAVASSRSADPSAPGTPGGPRRPGAPGPRADGEAE
jgi:hypothetical protein